MAGDYPQFVRGRIGDLHHYHLNKAFRQLEDMRAAASDGLSALSQAPEERNRVKREPIPADSTDRLIDADAPLSSKVIWEERWIDDDCQFVDEDIIVSGSGPGAPAIGFRDLGTGVSGGGAPGSLAYKRHGDADNGDAACLMTPPHGLIRHFRTLEGQHKFVWMPAMSLYAVEITEVTGVTPPDYIIKSVDDSWSSVIALTPVDRWPNIDYDPRQVGDVVMAAVTSSQASEIKLFAFEVPQFTQCPGGTPASAPLQPSGFDVASFIGV